MISGDVLKCRGGFLIWKHYETQIVSRQIVADNATVVPKTWETPLHYSLWPVTSPRFIFRNGDTVLASDCIK
jgi:hypothetical protein